MQLKNFIIFTFGMFAMATPVEQAAANEDIDIINKGTLTEADLAYCRELPRRWERRECREERDFERGFGYGPRGYRYGW